MIQLILENDKPVLPHGYRWLLRGEQVKEGDMWADTEFESWEPTRSWARAKVIADGELYIRKLEAKDQVPFAQQQHIS